MSVTTLNILGISKVVFPPIYILPLSVPWVKIYCIMNLLNLHLIVAVMFAAVVHLSHAVPVLSGAGELSETSGEGFPEISSASDLTINWHAIAKKLHHDVRTLKNEQFERDLVNITSLAVNSDFTPLIKASDGCLSKSFSAQKCLQRIYSGLQEYVVYMNYVERENLTETLVNDVKVRTNNLLQIIKNKLKDSPQTQLSQIELPDGSAWTRKTTVHSVLSNFATFLTDTSRAIHFMNRNSANESFLDKRHKGRANNQQSAKHQLDHM
ncbi:interleukin-6 [Chanos chanos]|uniref:Interleukin-6 n=1 Tax=Chanos chanos TaxID=29144 RepID=A0A6J2WJ78_CHACN|nr:interleukin-6 [Chanos chanos]